MRVSSLFGVLLLAACRPSVRPAPHAPPPVADASVGASARATPPVAPPAVTEVTDPGCPATPRIAVVHRRYEPRETSDAASVATPWVVHEVYDENVAENFETSAPPRVLDRAEAVRLGALDADDPVWVYTAPDTAPCRATAGRFWWVPSERGGDGYLEVVRELSGCEMPTDDSTQLVIALRQPTRPARCMFRRAEPAGGHADPTTHLPPDVAALIPSQPCPRATCRLLWQLTAVGFEGGATLSELTATYMPHRRGGPDCEGAWTDFHTTVYRPTSSGPFVRLDQAMRLYGALYDSAGPRVAISADVDTVRAHVLPARASEPVAPTMRAQWCRMNHTQYEGRGTLAPCCQL
ncbi:MAG: hypothetical protein U0326_44400 [Polyangiales bacterium]